MFGNPETTSGGRALKFYASVRLTSVGSGPSEDGQDLVGNRTRVKVVKNKVAPPFRQAEFDILYNEGISHTSLLVDLGVEHKVLDKSGSWYSYGDLRLGQGKENTRQFLLENVDIATEVEAKIRTALASVLGPPNGAEEDGGPDGGED